MNAQPIGQLARLVAKKGKSYSWGNYLGKLCIYHS